jgi:hypothetical protein
MKMKTLDQMHPRPIRRSKYKHPTSDYIRNRSWCCSAFMTVVGFALIAFLVSTLLVSIYGLFNFTPHYQIAYARRAEDHKYASHHIDTCTGDHKPPNSDMIRCDTVIYNYNMNVRAVAMFDALAVVYGIGTSNIKEYLVAGDASSYAPSRWCGTLCYSFLLTISQSSLACIVFLCAVTIALLLVSVLTVFCIRKCQFASHVLEETPPPYVARFVDERMTNIKQE